MHPWVWGRMRLYGVQGTQSVRADDEPETRPIIGEEGSTLRLTTTERRLKPRTSPESQPRLGFTGASKKILPIEFFLVYFLYFDALRLCATEACKCTNKTQDEEGSCSGVEWRGLRCKHALRWGSGVCDRHAVTCMSQSGEGPRARDIGRTSTCGASDPL